MPNPRLAGRYAKSLIDLSIEKNQLDQVYHDMLFLQSICKTNRDFVNMLKSPVIKADKKVKILEAITSQTIGPLTKAFNQLVVKKGRESYIPEIVNAFIDQYKYYKGIQIVKLTTAIPASEELKQSIVQKLKTEKNIKELELVTEVNEDIIGGFILEIGDQLVDASVAYDLNKVRMQFQNNDFIYKLR